MKNDTLFKAVKMGFTHCFLIKGKHYLLVDTGPPGSDSKWTRFLQENNIPASEIKWIFLTHGHWDHAGSLYAVKKMTGARAMIHSSEKDWIEKGLVKVPSGLVPTGDVMHFLMKAINPLVSMPEATIDIPLGYISFPLNDYEIPGKIIHTPGHTIGSMSLLLDSGEAFVGDLAMNGFPQIKKNGIPVVGDDLEEVKKSWKILLDHNVKMIYPAHGKPFSSQILDKLLDKNTDQ